MNRVLVSGHKGFIGSNLVRHLNDNGIEVQAFDISSPEDNPHFANRERVMDFLSSQNLDAIFHVGANSNTLDIDVNGMFLLNYEMTKWFADWSVLNQKPIIYSSSAANLGANGLYPSNLYGWSKYAAEDYIRKSSGVSLRYFNVYGPGESHKGQMASFVHQAFQQHSSGSKAKLFPGKPTRDFVHVDDVCAANLYSLENYSKLKLAGGVFEVGSGESHTFEEALDLFGLTWEYLPHEFIPAGYQQFTKAEPDKFLPGWEPKTDFFSGMNRYQQFLRESAQS